MGFGIPKFRFYRFWDLTGLGDSKVWDFTGFWIPKFGILQVFGFQSLGFYRFLDSSVWI